MRVFLDQIGCRLNYSEVETLAGRLRQAGHMTVDAVEQAQVVVFNSCAVTAEAARKSRQRLRSIAKRSPRTRIAVTGCWATLQPDAAADLPNVSLVVDNAHKDLLHTLLEPWSAELDDPDDLARIQPNGTPFTHLESNGPGPERRSRTRAFIKVQDGCDNKCTFCIVTVARGGSRSRTTASIVEEIQQQVESGVQEAVLTGVHLGSYGRDLDGSARTDLKALTQAVLTHTDIARLRLSSLEPWELADGFFDLWRTWSDRLCPHLHLPLQAGTDKQLRQMARRCTTASYRQLIVDARVAIPDLIVTSDLIVGFPGETDNDFVAGLDFIEEMRFAHAHIFPFSARAGTAAVAFAGQVAKDVKKERSRQMHALVAKTGEAERQRHLNTVRPVLWQGEGEAIANESGRLWTGLTDNYLRVMAVMPENVDLKNEIFQTRLNDLRGDTFFGTIVEKQ